MARVRKEGPMRADASEKSAVARNGKDATNSQQMSSKSSRTRVSPRKVSARLYRETSDSGSDEDDAPLDLNLDLIPRIPPMKVAPGKHIRLAPLKSLRDSQATDQDMLPVRTARRPLSPLELGRATKNEQKTARKAPKKVPAPVVQKVQINEIEENVEESIWCGSDASSSGSEDEMPSPRTFLKRPLRQPKAAVPLSKSSLGDFDLAILDLERLKIGSQSGEDARNTTKPNYESRPSTATDRESNNGAILHFSPPRLHLPRGDVTPERPVTPPPPPQSPSKSRLVSPSKPKARIPTPPHRPNLDAFWNADAVNSWNDQYSPKKPIVSPKKSRLLQTGASKSPTSSPRKAQSPTKRTRADIESKKAFHTTKQEVAAEFFVELDQKITGGKISELASATGGVKFIWSKTLNSTAGRANWRRETNTTRKLDGTLEVTQKHHASIELAEKVIDDEERLLNVLAHEFCHLANFMVSGIKDQPHGAQFKAWGRKCTAAFGDRGVEVTTKHSYEIDYKYMWQCSNDDCAMEFKRHSKSIDPKKQACGSCKGKLVQIKPVPRRAAGGGADTSAGAGDREGGAVVNGYAGFVKAHFADVRRAMPGASQKEVMEALGRKYRAEKQGLPKASSADKPNAASPVAESRAVDKIGRVLEIVTLSDDD